MKSFILTVFLLVSSSIFASEREGNLSKAATLIKELKTKSPEHDGVSLREYSIKDVDNDGTFEVLETINKTEEDSVGLLNTEIAPAFEWVNIYKFDKSKFIESTRTFKWFLTKRREFYSFWLNLVERPDVLSSDSKELIKNNKNQFKKTIEDLKKKTL